VATTVCVNNTPIPKVKDELLNRIYSRLQMQDTSNWFGMDLTLG
jgi:hypothetical protein